MECQKLDISDLSYTAVFENPVHFCWMDYPDRWELVLPDASNLSLAEANEILNKEFDDRDTARDALHEHFSESSYEFEPMMNYYYLLSYLKHPAQEAQTILYRASLPLTIILIDDEIVMALSGGGMDLSWEICEAYIRLGYYPPFHFSLPEMGGRCDTEIRDACIASAECVSSQAAWRIEQLHLLNC